MGNSAIIQFRYTIDECPTCGAKYDGLPVDDTEELWLPGATYEPHQNGYGSTHEVAEPLGVYFGMNSYRDNWPQIAAILMALFAHQSVSKVWYYGDYEDKPRRCTVDRVIELSRHYMGGE